MSSFVLFPTAARRRVSWPLLLSAGLHGALLVALLSASLNRTVTRISQDQAVMVTLISPQPTAAPTAAAASPATAEPLIPPEPENLPAPPPPLVPVKPELVQPKPQPRPKPRPKVKPQAPPKPKPQPKPVSKPAPRPVPQPKPLTPATRPTPPSPFHGPSAAASSASTAAPRHTAGNAGMAHKGGPRPVSRQQPAYPPRAYAQQVEGNVRVQFDVDESGRLTNVQILSATPPNVFEGEVRRALRRWRYAPGQPGKNLVVNIEFRIDQYRRR